MARADRTTGIRIFGITALVAIALAGCSATGEDPDAGEEPAPTPAGAVDTSCVARTWVLDIPDLASQMAIQLASDGLTVTDYAGFGIHTFTFTESGEVSESVDVTFTITATSDVGPQITVEQIQIGEPSGEWGWVGDSNVMEFANWDSGGYFVENIVEVGGVATEGAVALPSDPMGGTNMEIVCEGSALSTHTLSSPYTQHWTAES